ncbi:hypothetical protein OHA43_33965 [Streptomyces sp. NBC_00305]|uniref:hypothetical protein n=2 Tax=unclassified Streptomyces TaxID=2593676 RepID=UPI002E157B5D|nr:hypothetical protein [Streptomyces sp. NBC_00305]WSP45457.1 hypothetical protein OG348_06125 [Streptomyces sp. NBC_01243]
MAAVAAAAAVAGAEAAGGSTPAIRRSVIAGRRAMISGGAVRRGRTATGPARRSETGAGAVSLACCDADAVAAPGAVPPTRAVLLAGAAAPAASTAVAPPARSWRPGAPFPEEPGDFVLLDLWTAVGTDDRPRALSPPVVLPAEAGAGPAAASASPSAPAGAARSSSGPPGAVDRAPPGRATPWIRPTGADGSTAWPSSPANARFCHDARPSRNRRPSLTPIEDRATVTAGGATRRQPPSQSPSPEPPRPPSR